MKRKLKEAVQQSRQQAGGGVSYIRLTIPPYSKLSEEERSAVDAGEPWPVRIETRQVGPGVARVIEFLSQSAVEAGRLDHLKSDEAVS